MKRMLLILNLVLAALAVAVTSYLLKPVTTRVDQQLISPVSDADATPLDPPDIVLPWSPLKQETVLIIAGENLFSEARVYVEPQSDEPDAQTGEPVAAEPEPSPEEYKLIGLLRVGDRAVASMIVRGAAAQSADAAGPTPPGRQRNPIRPPDRAAAVQETKGIFAVGDEVGAIGYTLAEIGQDFVRLERPAQQADEPQSLTVSIDRGDETSTKRREAAREDAEKKLQEAREALENQLIPVNATDEPPQDDDKEPPPKPTPPEQRNGEQSNGEQATTEENDNPDRRNSRSRPGSNRDRGNDTNSGNNQRGDGAPVPLPGGGGLGIPRPPSLPR